MTEPATQHPPRLPSEKSRSCHQQRVRTPPRCRRMGDASPPKRPPIHLPWIPANPATAGRKLQRADGRPGHPPGRSPDWLANSAPSWPTGCDQETRTLYMPSPCGPVRSPWWHEWRSPFGRPERLLLCSREAVAEISGRSRTALSSASLKSTPPGPVPVTRAAPGAGDALSGGRCRPFVHLWSLPPDGMKRDNSSTWSE